MREGMTEPGGCHAGTSLSINAGIHSQAPEKLVPEKIYVRYKARDLCSAPLEQLPLCNPWLITTLRNGSP